MLDQDEKYILNSPREISLNAELDHEEIDYFLKALEGVLVDLSERCRTLVNLLKKRD